MRTNFIVSNASHLDSLRRMGRPLRSAIELALTVLGVLAGVAPAAEPGYLQQPPNTWVKRSPLPGGPVSPGLGYECALAYDPVGRRVLRWAGHNQGGGGEQNAETWAYDPVTARWELKEP